MLHSIMSMHILCIVTLPIVYKANESTGHPPAPQVMDQYEAQGSCLEAASAAAEKLCGEVAASTLHCVKLLSRCLALRSLLGEACAAALSQATPWLVAAVETMVTTSEWHARPCCLQLDCGHMHLACIIRS
jgi:hypothetical protein